MTCFYYTITTITTVGYGDYSASTFAEQIVACILMFIGVIGFGVASSSLTNVLMQEEIQNESLRKRTETLDMLHKQH